MDYRYRFSTERFIVTITVRNLILMLSRQFCILVDLVVQILLRSVISILLLAKNN